MKDKIGILGGSFNPIHSAHIALAKYFLDEIDANKVIFVPCNISPFKTSDEVADSKFRLEMVAIAIKNMPNFEVSDYEINRKGISYTYQTINHFSNIYTNNEICLLIGGDQAENFHKWKNWEQILDKANVYVALRKGYKIPTYDFEKYKKAVYLEMPFIDISASEIREQIKNNKTDIKFLDSEVEKYIKDNKIY